MAWARWAASFFWGWTVLGTVWAWFFPEHFTWALKREPVNLIAIGLGIIMLGMGMTLRFADLRDALKLPKAALIGILGQFLLMPFIGWSVVQLFQLKGDLAVGMILVSCCPGGTASNVVCFLARANVALSVLMTMCSTLLAIGLTPYLTKGYAAINQSFHVDAPQMVLTMITIVLLPVLAGILLNTFLGKRLNLVREISPLASILVIVIIVGAIIGDRKGDILEHKATLLPAVFVLHAAGFLIGYGWARLFRLQERESRTVCIEVGMQNSGLGSSLATKHFSVLAATPCAISALYHCLIGSFLASIWRTKSQREEGQAEELARTPD